MRRSIVLCRGYGAVIFFMPQFDPLARRRIRLAPLHCSLNCPTRRNLRRFISRSPCFYLLACTLKTTLVWHVQMHLARVKSLAALHKRLVSPSFSDFSQLSDHHTRVIQNATFLLCVKHNVSSSLPALYIKFYDFGESFSFW